MSDISAPPAPAAISLRQTIQTSKWLNATCPKCQKPIAVNDQVVLCPKCYTPQHAQCWRDNGNACAIDQTPARIVERSVRAPAGESAAAAAPAAAPAAPAPRPQAAPAAAAPPAAAVAASVPAALSNPWADARVVQAPPESDLWRRNVMTLVVIIVLWAIIMLSVYLAASIFGFGPGVRA